MYKKGFLSILLFSLILCLTSNNLKKEVKPEEPKEPKATNINDYIFGHKDYNQTIDVFKEWEKESPDLIDIFSYGKSTNGKDLYCIKISNEYTPGNKVILITACIHGNEPLSTSTTLSYIGHLLSMYKKDSRITDIVNNNQIYYVPVVSPDTYPNQRHVDGVDPNRDFPTLKNPNKVSVVPIERLKELFMKIKPDSVISGHTYGRVFLSPWGDSTENCPNHDKYKELLSKMSELSKYKNIKASQLYGKPIYGTEIDWYQRNGAFAIVMEFGTHQKKPSLEDTKDEHNRTLESILLFLEKSTASNF